MEGHQAPVNTKRLVEMGNFPPAASYLYATHAYEPMLNHQNIDVVKLYTKCADVKCCAVSATIPDMCADTNAQLSMTSRLTIHINKRNLPPAVTSCRCGITRDPLFDDPETKLYRNFMPSFKESVSPPGQGFITRLQNDTSGVESRHVLGIGTENNVIADTWNLTYVLHYPNTQEADVSENYGFIFLSGTSMPCNKVFLLLTM